METVTVKPKDGARIRQPERDYRVMPIEGCSVPRDAYYERLIMTGDVIVVEPKPQTRPKHRGTQNRET